MSAPRRADHCLVGRLLEHLLTPTIRRLGLAMCVVVLATATHWPRLRIEGPIARPDLWIHLAAFGVLGVAIAMAALFGPIGSRRNLLWTWVVGVAYAAVDEATQAIPILGRTAAWDDFAADVAGVTIGVVGVALACRVRRTGTPSAAPAPTIP